MPTMHGPKQNVEKSLVVWVLVLTLALFFATRLWVNHLTILSWSLANTVVVRFKNT